MRTTTLLTIALSSAIALSGLMISCARPAASPSQASIAAAVTDANGGYVGQQGIWLHGTTGQRGLRGPSPFEGTQADIPFAGATTGDGQPYSSLRIEHGQLQGTIGSKVFEGNALIGTRLWPRDHGYVLTIEEVDRHTNIYTGQDSGLWQYQVSWAPSDEPAATARLCAQDYAALAVPGSWRSGQLQPDDGVFSFACVPIHGYRTCSNASPLSGSESSARRPRTLDARARPPAQIEDHSDLGFLDAGCNGGVIAKCIDYGYAPWPDTPALLRKLQLGDSFRLQNTSEVAHRLHNLCVAAMRADYDGDDHAHTLEGTPIRLFDATNLSRVVGPGSGALPSLNSLSDVAGKLPPDLDETHVGRLRMEGLWTVDSSGRAQAVCLEKERWQTLDSTKSISCDQLLDLCKAHSSQMAPRCETLQRPLIVSYSAHIDRLLYRFSDGSSSLTTTHVIKGPDGRLAPDPDVFCRAEPAATAKCKCPVTYAHVELEGTILSPDLYKMFEKYTNRDRLFSDLGRLSSYREPDCHMVTTTVPMHRPRIDEGYVLGVHVADGHDSLSFEDLRLFLWPMASGAVTAVTEPQDAERQAIANRQFLGYVLRRDDQPSPRASELLRRLPRAEAPPTP